MPWGLWLALPLVTGCTYKAPRVSVAGAQITATSTEAIVVTFDLLVANPNARTLELDELRYTLTIEGREVYTGRRRAGANLSILGEQRIALPAVVPATEASATPLPCTLRGWLRYRTPGQIAQRLFDTGVRRPKVGFRYDGRIEWPVSSAP